MDRCPVFLAEHEIPVLVVTVPLMPVILLPLTVPPDLIHRAGVEVDHPRLVCLRCGGDDFVGDRNQGLAFVAGFATATLVGTSTEDTPQDPALGIAQEIGMAIPEPQYAAFADGQITFDEVNAAADAFRSCAESENVEGFSVTVTADSMEMPYSDINDRNAVEQCRTRYFAATQSVYSMTEPHNLR